MRVLCFEINYIGFDFKSSEVEKEVVKSWILNNSRIDALKTHRSITGSSIRDAKDFTDSIRNKYFPNHSYDSGRSWSEFINPVYKNKVNRWLRG